MTLIFFVYFWFTNKDIFKYVICRIDEKIKQNVKVTRASALKKLDIARKKQVHVDNYVDYDFKIKKIEDNSFYDKEMILKVFDQNLNLKLKKVKKARKSVKSNVKNSAKKKKKSVKMTS